jgi:hypothetical protein
MHAALVPFQKGNVSDWILAIGKVPSKRQQRNNVGIIGWLLPLVVCLEGKK